MEEELAQQQLSTQEKQEKSGYQDDGLSKEKDEKGHGVFIEKEEKPIEDDVTSAMQADFGQKVGAQLQQTAVPPDGISAD